MPYIRPSARESLKPATDAIDAAGITNVGELNYLLTKVCLSYLRRHRPTSYVHLNDVVGALGCALQEFYRRQAVPYEEGKICENGDVV